MQSNKGNDTSSADVKSAKPTIEDLYAELGKLGCNVEKLRSWSMTYEQLQDFVNGINALRARHAKRLAEREGKTTRILEPKEQKNTKCEIAGCKSNALFFSGKSFRYVCIAHKRAGW